MISIDEKRGRIGFSMKPESEKPARPAVKPATTNNDEKASRPRPNRPAGDKRPSKPKRQDGSNSNSRSKVPRAEKAEVPSKMGTFGALLQEAGVTKAKK